MEWRLSLCVLFLAGFRLGCGAPNIVLILADDLDLMLQGLKPLEKLQRLLIDKGAVFERAYTSSPICCPSRASILTGRYAHNHQVYNNSRPGGCYSEMWRADMEPFTFANILKQDASYETFFAGKYLNEYRGTMVPPGWDHFYGLQGNSAYYDYKLNVNGQVKSFGNDSESYLTKVIKDYAIEFLMHQNFMKPFLAVLSVPSPHAPFTPEEKYKKTFADVKAYRSESFNKAPAFNEKHWLLSMPPGRLSDATLQHLDEIYRKRWQTLLSVDDLVEEVIITLDKLDLLNDTYVVFTSDNGYHIGQFAQPFDKRLPYETDINVPLIVRGPTVKGKTVVRQPAALIDLAPTFLSWAGVDYQPDDFDGINLSEFFDETVANETYERQLLIEYWGEHNDDWLDECGWRRKDQLFDCKREAECKCQDAWNNTYSCVRHLASDLNFVYCKFKDLEQFHEAYDLLEDPHQLHNVAYDILPSQQAKYSLVIDHLCECLGESCREGY